MDDSAEPPEGEVIASYGDEVATWYTASATGLGFILRFPNVGEFVISEDLAQMTVRRDPSGRPELLPILLAGTASAFLLTLRGQTVLHASAGRGGRVGVGVRRPIGPGQIDPCRAALRGRRGTRDRRRLDR